MRGTRRRSVFTSRLVNSAESGQQPHVLEDLRQAILAGDEPPGTPIPIETVARFFKVSQIPVREALKILLGEGLVEHVPHVGYSVAKLTFEEFSELYDVRQALDSAALRVAALKATSADTRLVRDAHDALASAIATGDERAYHAESRNFHTALILPSGMQRLLHMYESAWNLTEAARPMARVSAQRQQVFHDDHDRMIEAFVARDTERLVAESQIHYEHLKTAISALADDPDLFRPAEETP